MSAVHTVCIAEHDFSVGDLVELISGSPPLAVEHVNGDRITVTWWSEVSGDICEADLTADVLVRLPVEADDEADDGTEQVEAHDGGDR